MIVKKSISQADDTEMNETAQLRRAIEELQAENQRLQHVLKTKTSDHNRALEEAQALTHLGSWEWDVAADHITWSDELYRIYGMKPQERAIGFGEFLELIHPDDRDMVNEIITASFKNGRPFEFEHRIILPSGKERILKGMGKSVKDESGVMLRMLGTSQDITQAKQLDRAKDEFISLVSHQLRTPLSIVRLHGSVLQDGMAGELTPKQETHVRTMTTASVRLIELVDDILRISRISLNRLKVTTEPTDPNELISACVEEAAPIAREKGAKISFTPNTTLGLVPIDTTIFGEILRNLISNAVRYASEKDGRMTVRFEKKKSRYLLSVEDNGIGVPPEDQAHIFERFYRANNANAVDSSGSGLGLYIVKLFVDAIGGKIWLESTVGKGTTFYVSFPARGMQTK